MTKDVQERPRPDDTDAFVLLEAEQVRFSGQHERGTAFNGGGDVLVVVTIDADTGQLVRTRNDYSCYGSRKPSVSVTTDRPLRLPFLRERRPDSAALA